MSSPQPPSSPAQAHQGQQAVVAAALLAALAQAWALVDVGNLVGTLPTFKAAVVHLVQQYGAASTKAALNYYKSARHAAVPGLPPRFKMPSPIAREQIEKTVGWAVQDLWGISPTAKEHTGGHAAGASEPDEAHVVEAAKSKLDAAAERLALDAGRNEMIAWIKQDRAAKGWARIAEPGACSFCAMLATRGSAYRTKASASFETHDHCRCHVEPVFSDHYEPSAQARDWQRIWEESTRGKSGNEARKAFRRALEGRDDPAAVPAEPQHAPV